MEGANSIWISPTSFGARLLYYITAWIWLDVTGHLIIKPVNEQMMEMHEPDRWCKLTYASEPSVWISPGCKSLLSSNQSSEDLSVIFLWIDSDWEMMMMTILPCLTVSYQRSLQGRGRKDGVLAQCCLHDEFAFCCDASNPVNWNFCCLTRRTGI